MHQIKLALLPTLCAPLAGGYFGGLFRLDGKLYANIVADEEGELTGPWNKSADLIEGAGSYNDGLSNTHAMAAMGSEIAMAARALRIGGFDDWHIGARDIVELTYRHFKPTPEDNYQYRSGDNPSSVPAGYPYTDSDPAQTTSDVFQEGADAALEDSWYWTSTQSAADAVCAWIQHFDDGYQIFSHKTADGRGRAVRRLLVIE